MLDYVIECELYRLQTLFKQVVQSHVTQIFRLFVLRVTDFFNWYFFYVKAAS